MNTNQIKTGGLIRRQRQKLGLTQLELAERIGVGDKAVSKWERGCGAPDISLLPKLAEVLQVDAVSLLKGEMGENDAANGDMKRLNFYVCPCCGNLMTSTDSAEVVCCGKRLSPLNAQPEDGENSLNIEKSDGEWYITSAHPMSREHHISFIAFLTGDTLIVRRLYPEWGLETRLPYFAKGTLLWYCTRHGLFAKEVRG